ncbi:MAG: glycosyltransferase [Anaerolineae bacterium]
MKVLFVGQLAEGQTSRMRMDVLRGLGHTVIPLDSQARWHQLSWARRRLEQKLSWGPSVSYLNETVLALAQEHKPDLFWGEKQEYVSPDTVLELRKRGIQSLHFTPDPYFTLAWKRTRLMDACLPLFDYVICCKQYEMAEYERTCRRVLYMPLGYAEAVHRPIAPADRGLRRRFQSDVSFVGGWDPRRQRLLGAVADRMDCELKIWGYGWDHLQDGRWSLRRAYRLRLMAGGEPFQLGKDPGLSGHLQGPEVYGDEYAWALSGARIALGFLRQICPDEHTTRTFEIPACASLLLADRTPEHQSFFREGQEADFFSSEEELLDKVRFYLANEEVREKVAWRGYQRCVDSGYSYSARLESALTGLGISPA